MADETNFADVNGDPIFIEGLKIKDFRGDECVRGDSPEVLEKIVKAMGWEGSAQFKSDTGVGTDELVGKYWTVVRDRVFVMDEEVVG